MFNNDINTQNNSDEEDTKRGKQLLQFQFIQTWNMIEWYVPIINKTVIVMLLYMGVGGSDLQGRVYTDVILIHTTLKFDRVIYSKHQQICNCYATLHGRGGLWPSRKGIYRC